jgi:transcriptional regulator with XRE-family HTH domain
MEQSSIYQLLRPDDLPGGPDPLGVLIGQRIRDRRRALGMTQTELAGPYTKSYVSAVENGRVMPSVRTLWFIADRLGVGVGDLVDGVKPVLTVEYNSAHDAAGPGNLYPSTSRRRPA